MLYVENLRLRASEIALASQLKREREESRKILVDAEAAVLFSSAFTLDINLDEIVIVPETYQTPFVPT